ncbi:hypothetical protein FHG87_025090 [Trinorchestia longiramus]|nr:hypothetical protein FHG87_025090 [Trinorchestia longiramus]
MICNVKLSNSSLAPEKLREHFLKLHGDGKYKNTTFAEFKVKRARFDKKATLPVLSFVPIKKTEPHSIVRSCLPDRKTGRGAAWTQLRSSNKSETRRRRRTWVRQPFTFSVERTDVNDEYLDEIIEIQQSQVQQQFFRTTTLSMFWCQLMVTYPGIAEKALEIFIPFVTTHLYEQSFSRMLDIKTKKMNRHCGINDMRVALAKVKARISELVPGRQQQNSH